MPEYLAPGVYIEETSFRAKSIEGVSTTTTGFIGPTRYGPVEQTPDLLTSVGEFEYVYGDPQPLQFYKDAGTGAFVALAPISNFLWHGTRGFFSEGGKRLYVSRIFRPLQGSYPPTAAELASAPTVNTTDGKPLYEDGHARAFLATPAPTDPATRAKAIQIRARFPGAAGNMRVRITVRLSQNLLGFVDGRTTVGALADRDVVLVKDVASPPESSPDHRWAFLAERSQTPGSDNPSWDFVDENAGSALPPALPPPADWSPPANLMAQKLRTSETDEARVITLTLSVSPPNGSPPTIYDSLPLDLRHHSFGEADSIFDRFAAEPANSSLARTLPVVIAPGSAIRSGLDVLRALVSMKSSLWTAIINPDSSDLERSVDIDLGGGNDGLRPGLTEYDGAANPASRYKTGLKQLEDIEDISIVAAPGATYGYAETSYQSQAKAINGVLIAHVERMRYRIAVLDSGDKQAISDVRAMRGQIDSKHAALYYPWVTVFDPVTRRELNLPPSGFVAGIYARNDITRAVYKAPANEVVNLAIGFELLLNKAQQDVLNPEGINCFRFFEGRGFRLWGARTISSDPEWKYVNLRRYFNYLERSIDKGTQWAVFEPNGEILWANVRRTIEDFLLNEWQSGALLGDKPEKAFFVRCDRSTMTQNNLDNGQLVCLIGVAALRPAEYVIFRIGQWTGDRRG
jgi:phage tail sheath protein FI